MTAHVHALLVKSLREMVDVYWGAGDGQEPPPACIIRAQAALDAATKTAPRFFVSPHTDGPSTAWNVIDRRTQEWVRRFPFEKQAIKWAAHLERVNQ